MRGQAHTLEAFIAAILLLSSLTFALQVTAVTPLSASTSNQHIENQQRASGAGALAAADESGALSDITRYWDASEGRFHDADRFTYYTDDYPPGTFGNVINRSFAGRGLAVNVFIHYQEDGGEETQELIYRGEPSDNAASASRTVTLYEDDPLLDEAFDEGRQLSELGSDEFYAGNEYEGDVFNVLRVEVIVWRM